MPAAGLAVAGLALAAGITPAAPAATAAAQAGPGARRVLPAYVPMWATLVADDGSATADLGPAPAGAPASARVYLAGRDPQELAAYATAVSAPGSPLFRRYLSPAQV